MTDLQLGLVLIGAGAVAAVVIYNRLQERGARRAVERAFGAPRGDVLLGDGRVEPALGRVPTPAPVPQVDALPDERVDYVMLLRMPAGMPSAALLKAWGPVESRFGKRVLLAGSDRKSVV